jgi:hypothetical protein
LLWLQQVLIKGYQDNSLPTNETIRKRLNQLGYSLKRVAKTKPKKRIDETDAIFKQIDKVNQEANADPHKGVKRIYSGDGEN